MTGENHESKAQLWISKEAEERHVDVAARYSSSMGFLDFGLSAFAGANREPFFLLSGYPAIAPDQEEFSLISYGARRDSFVGLNLNYGF